MMSLRNFMFYALVLIITIKMASSAPHQFFFHFFLNFTLLFTCVSSTRVNIFEGSDDFNLIYICLKDCLIYSLLSLLTRLLKYSMRLSQNISMKYENLR